MKASSCTASTTTSVPQAGQVIFGFVRSSLTRCSSLWPHFGQGMGSRAKRFVFHRVAMRSPMREVAGVGTRSVARGGHLVVPGWVCHGALALEAKAA